MRSREDEAAVGVVLQHQVRAGRGGKKAVLSDDEFFNAVCCRHLDEFLDGGLVIITAVAADNEDFSLHVADSIKNTLDEILEVIRLHHDFCFFTEAAGSHFLVGVRCRRNGFNHVFPLQNYQY